MSRKPKPRLFSAGAVAVVMVVAALVAGLLAARPLDTAAHDISSNTLRSAALVLTRPLAGVSGFLGLDRIERWAVALAEPAEAGGSNGDAPPGEPVSPTTSTTSTISTSSSTTSSVIADGSTTPGPSSPVSSSTATATTAAVAEEPVFTAGNPLRVVVIGDSLVQQVGQGMMRASVQWPLQVDYRYKINSGFATLRHFDWLAEIERLLARFTPHVVVMMFGNNDKTNMLLDGRPLERFSPDWWVEYRRRVEVGVELARSSGARVIWLGMPIMRSSVFSETARAFNQVYAEIAEQAGASYVDTYALLSTGDGQYAPYLPNAEGKSTLMREADGIHLTQAGGDMVAAEIIALLKRGFDLQM